MACYYVEQLGLFESKRRATRSAFRLLQTKRATFVVVNEGERVDGAAHLAPGARPCVIFYIARGLIVRRNV